MKALLLTYDKYPDIDAGAVRIHMFGKILKNSGFCVHVISMGKTTGFKKILEKDGIEHTSYRGKSDKVFWKAIYHVFFPLRLKTHLLLNDYDVIIHTQLDLNSLKTIQFYGRKKQIPVIYDSVEWFSKTQFAKGEKAISYIRNDKYNTTLIKNPSSVIAISSYLEKHFKSRGIKTIRIPVIMDTQATKVIKNCNTDTLRLLYAGVPGKKDYISNVLKAIALLNGEERAKVKFVMCGCTEQQLMSICDIDEAAYCLIKDCLEIKGYISREQVLEEYSKADFSILIRDPEQRYAKAGFPTKFVESLCCSTPVICNLTSDLSEFVKDQENCIILKGTSPEEIAETMRKIFSISKSQREEMNCSARKAAQEYFDYSIYSKKLIDFIGAQQE